MLSTSLFLYLIQNGRVPFLQYYKIDRFSTSTNSTFLLLGLLQNAKKPKKAKLPKGSDLQFLGQRSLAALNERDEKCKDEPFRNRALFRI
jgi:hypothetical protein